LPQLWQEIAVKVRFLVPQLSKIQTKSNSVVSKSNRRLPTSVLCLNAENDVRAFVLARAFGFNLEEDMKEESSPTRTTRSVKALAQQQQNPRATTSHRKVHRRALTVPNRSAVDPAGLRFNKDRGLWPGRNATAATVIVQR
jgi:hypothetical protein